MCDKLCELSHFEILSADHRVTFFQELQLVSVFFEAVKYKLTKKQINK